MGGGEREREREFIRNETYNMDLQAHFFGGAGLGLVAADPAVPFCAPAAGTFGAPAGVFDVAPGDLLLRWGRARARVGQEQAQREREKSNERQRERVRERVEGKEVREWPGSLT